jgi:hypothetical protein
MVAPLSPSAQTLPRPTAPAAVPLAKPTSEGQTPESVGRSAVWPLVGALVLVVVVLIVAAALAPNAEAPSGAATDATPTVAPTPNPTPMPTASPEGPAQPEWLAGLVEDVREACGDEEAEGAAAEMSAMSRGQARKHARELVKECKEDGDG